MFRERWVTLTLDVNKTRCHLEGRMAGPKWSHSGVS